jgi:hypothetical protein
MTEPTFDENALREVVRRRINEGRLPCRRQDHTWAGKGTGLDCMVCELPITSLQVEYELQFGGEASGGGVTVVRMHRPCFSAWESECSESS